MVQPLGLQNFGYTWLAEHICEVAKEDGCSLTVTNDRWTLAIGVTCAGTSRNSSHRLPLRIAAGRACHNDVSGHGGLQCHHGKALFRMHHPRFTDLEDEDAHKVR